MLSQPQVFKNYILKIRCGFFSFLAISYLNFFVLHMTFFFYVVGNKYLLKDVFYIFQISNPIPHQNSRHLLLLRSFFLKIPCSRILTVPNFKGEVYKPFPKALFLSCPPPPYCLKFLARSNAFNHKQLIFPDVSVLFFILSSIINFFQNLFCCCVGSYGFTTYTFTLCVRNMRIIPTW